MAKKNLKTKSKKLDLHSTLFQLYKMILFQLNQRKGVKLIRNMI